ncbi:MAG: adenylyltransferase/cytidyltransferase family protein [Acidimicrobiales bacterium]
MPRRQGSVVTIGAYDGLHLGHRRVIDDVCRLAVAGGLESIVVTFDRHPASVVRPASAPLQLTDLPQRLELLHDTGIDDVLVIEFTPERAAESAEDFVDEVLVGDLAARIVVVGRDFHFGHGRGGNVALLEKMGEDRGFRVQPFDLVEDEQGHEVVSSTRIRALIAEADLGEAARLLGRLHETRGLVIGEASSFPGAGDGDAGVSVEIPRGILLPPPGGYQGWAGLVGAAGVPLQRCHILVPPDQGALAVLGIHEAWVPGSPVRVLFERLAGASPFAREP